ncbi:hypothetical protein Tco_0529714 [Tanacetum coccineum]
MAYLLHDGSARKWEQRLKVVVVIGETGSGKITQLTQRAVMEPLPPKDDKGSQNRTKVSMIVMAAQGMISASNLSDERRLTELRRRTIELFVLSHIFSKIEVEYQEAVALKRQEELIREEEAELMTGFELKAKWGASEKDKKSKKKQIEFLNLEDTLFGPRQLLTYHFPLATRNNLKRWDFFPGICCHNKIKWLYGRSLIMKTAKGHDVESSYYLPLKAWIGGTHSRQWISIEKGPTWPSRATMGSKELAIVIE